MKRNIKKQMKRLKRERNKNKKGTALKNRYWYSVYCMREKLFIGVSYAEVRREKGKIKVHMDQWSEGNCKWRTPEHKIDMNNKKEGDIIHCPKCNSAVDFRLWLSATKPEFATYVNKENNPEELPNIQAARIDIKP